MVSMLYPSKESTSHNAIGWNLTSTPHVGQQSWTSLMTSNDDVDMTAWEKQLSSTPQGVNEMHHEEQPPLRRLLYEVINPNDADDINLSTQIQKEQSLVSTQSHIECVKQKDVSAEHDPCNGHIIDFNTISCRNCNTMQEKVKRKMID